MEIKQEILEAEYELTGLTQAEYNILRRALDDAISKIFRERYEGRRLDYRASELKEYEKLRELIK
jgi:hypothetical protein